VYTLGGVVIGVVGLLIINNYLFLPIAQLQVRVAAIEQFLNGKSVQAAPTPKATTNAKTAGR